MKKIFVSFTALAVLTAVSCTREECTGVSPVSEGELVTFRVGVSAEQTRVTGDVSEDDVNSLQVFVFGSSGGLERSAYVEKATSVEMTCYSGTKEIVAIVNKSEMEISSIDELNSEVTYLEESTDGNFFMYGSEKANVTANGIVSILVSRRVARFVLKSVTNGVPSSSSNDLYLNNVYLINVAGDARYDGTESYSPEYWYNVSGLEKTHRGAAYDFLCDELGDELLSVGGTYDTQHIFYCCPNVTAGRPSGNRPTRLIVEATLYDTLWYYPIVVDDVESNYSYEIDLTITGAGADTPDSDDELVSFKFTISVAGWEQEPISKEI